MVKQHKIICSKAPKMQRKQQQQREKRRRIYTSRNLFFALFRNSRHYILHTPKAVSKGIKTRFTLVFVDFCLQSLCKVPSGTLREWKNKRGGWLCKWL
jgi:hypothetical protein